MFKAEYVFVRILFPFLLGICVLYFFPTRGYIQLLTVVLFVILLSILFLNITYKRLNVYRYKGAVGILIFILFFSLGGLLCLLHNESLNQNYFAKTGCNYLKVWVNNEPQQSSNVMRFKVQVVSGYQKDKQISLSGQMLLAVKLDSIKPIKLKYGDEIIISVRYTEVEPPYNPAEFDFKAWLGSQNIYHQAFIDQDHIVKNKNNVGNPVIKMALNLREQQVAKYRSLIKNDEAFAVASTLILGYRADLSKETLSAYSKTGTIHALSVSGAHVVIIYVVLDFLFFFLNKNRALRIVKLLLICTLIWGYALLTGLSPSVVRSAIMITILITAKVLSKKTNSYNVLAFSAFCQLIYNPFLIWDVGFQLSYLAVFGLIYLQPKIYNLLYTENNWIDKLWRFTAMSLAAQVVTFPLSIYYFHQFPLYFLFANLFITIPLILMMYLGIAVLVPSFGFLAPVFEWIINFTNAVLKWIASLPYASFSSVWINLPEFVLLSLSLGLFIYALAKFNKPLLFSSLFLFVCYQLLVVHDDLRTFHQRKIIFFSLRKNYAAAFIHGKEAVLVSDLSVEDKNYNFSIEPALTQLQVDKIYFINFKKDTVLGQFVLKNNQIAFFYYKILLIDENLNYKKINGNATFFSIWFSGNTKFNLAEIGVDIKYKNAIIDASNKDYKIQILKKHMENNNIDVHILKKNKAYLVQLTQ
ncbi:ComEC family competence protein [Pedobacter psychrodurus]|uniref:ComEC family competence protein n=1 Tax=Pedobacter psychrodurus TaxID=2530456 RepID=A0A4R0Q0C2_9SPHI|nr:ComEC/Rec2 family competence protein [Pedobacter psychrodurus]TCD24747.1 ComEC family competence protein [Pedobacter psychrodurus]